ncbi:hypothetical protein EIP86_004690 [Pleurotus ostreatoroseus]|nr:hypothetical protein EIP86_004690 [Pleurotus ostreatoroseus]
MSNDDDSSRPSKRPRIELSLSQETSSSTLTPPPSSPLDATEDLPESSAAQHPTLRPLPEPVLLVTLPRLLIHPPNHRNYIKSLFLSLCSLRRCLTLLGLSPEIECQAWLGLAELGMKVVHGGLSQNEAHPWATGIEAEVEKAISKGSLIAKKHPSLRAYKPYFTLLRVHFSHWQQKSKFSKTQIRNLISSFTPNDPPYIVYSAHLAAVSIFTAPKPVSNPLTASSTQNQATSTSFSSPAYSKTAQDIHAALASVSDIQTMARTQGHPQIILLSHVLRLRILVAANMWNEVAATIQLAEAGLGLSYEPATTPKPPAPGKENVGVSPEKEKEKGKRRADDRDEFISYEDPFEAAMAVHTLMMSVVYFTHVGAAAESAPRLSHLHALLDSGALEKFSDGTVEAKIPGGPPLMIQVTHPRVLFLLAFLVSSVAKRDAVGRKPKRKVFATEGLRSWEQELGQDITSHALNQPERASQCYQVAASLADKGSFVALSAQAGEIVLRAGLAAAEGTEGCDAVDSKAAMGVAKACRGMGGTLEAVGQVVEALVSPEIIKAKQHLKQALDIASKSQDNHLRAVVLALISAHYLHTAEAHALGMLKTCEQLAAGLGAPAVKSSTAGPTGSVRLGLWVGQKLLELYKREGKEPEVQKQMAINQRLEEAVKALDARGITTVAPKAVST